MSLHKNTKMDIVQHFPKGFDSSTPKPREGWIAGMCDGPLALALRNAGEGLLEGGIGQRPSMRNPQAQQAGRVDVGMAGQVY